MVPSPPIATSASTPCAFSCRKRLALRVRLGELREARGLQHGAAALQDAAHVARAQLRHHAARQALVGALDADHAHAKGKGGAHHGAHGRVHARGVAPCGQDCNAFRARHGRGSWCRASLTCVKRRGRRTRHHGANGGNHGKGISPAARSAAEQGHRVHREGARRPRPARPAAAARALPGRAGQANAGAHSPPADRPGEVHRAQRAARPQRDAVLPRRLRQHRRNAAAHLHADGRPRLPEVRPHLPAPARPVHRRQRPRPRRAGAAQLALHARHHRRERRRTDPRPGRPRRERHGHSGGQALALHGLRGHPPRTVPAGDPGRRHQQRRAARRSLLHRPAAAPAARHAPTTNCWRSSSPRRRRCSPACWSSSRTSPTRTRSACCRSTATGSRPSTTTSRAPPR